jgi:hypothetical protein
MDPCIWGPPIWKLLHASAAAGAPAELIDRTLETMAHVLPCAKCRGSLAKFLPRLAKLGFADSVTKLWFLHNLVNRKLGKPAMPFRRAERLWETRSVPAAPLELADSLAIVDGNYRRFARAGRSQHYAAWWARVADLCALHGGLRPMAAQMRRNAGITQRAPLMRTLALRRALMGPRSESARRLRAKVDRCSAKLY